MNLDDSTLKNLRGQERRTTATRAGCLSAETLGRAASGELGLLERGGVADHLAACADCAEELRLIEPLGAFAERTAVALGRSPATVRPASGRTWAWQYASAAVLIVVGGTLAVWNITLQRENRDLASPAATPTVATEAAPSAPPVESRPAADSTVAKPAAPPWLVALSLVKADIHVSPRDAFPVRSVPPAGEVPLDALARALDPYRRDDYRGAAEAFSALVAKYPQSDRPNFYLGVSLLFLDRPQEAVAPLSVAKASGLPAVARDARWYLAVALARRNQPDAALLEVEALCIPGEADAPRACAARDALRARSR